MLQVKARSTRSLTSGTESIKPCAFSAYRAFIRARNPSDLSAAFVQRGSAAIFADHHHSHI